MARYIRWIKPKPDEVGGEESGLARVYKWIWSRLGGRPYTYMIKDAWHRYPLIWVFGFVGLAGLMVFLTLIFWDSSLYRIVMFSILGFGGFFLFLGACLGHLFWGV